MESKYRFEEAMLSNELKFRLSEEARLMKAMLLAGLKIKRVTKDEQGRPVYVVDQGEDESADKADQKNDFDSVYEHR